MVDHPGPAAGTLYTFPLENGLHGACRVLRAPQGDEGTRYAGHMLVCGTPWVGTPDAAAKHPDIKKVLRAVGGPALYWVAGLPPPQFAAMGTVPIPKADLTKTSHSTAPWEIFPNVVYKAWQRDATPALAEATKAQAERDAERIKAAAVEALARTETIDLAGFVPFDVPASERTPEKVLGGFIAAMHQWERECARIAAKHGPTAVVRFNREPLQRIFDEFCTKKDRPNGRLGTFSSPPEYDPARETIVEVTRAGAKRVEIETVRRRVTEQRVRYVLLERGGRWAIDGRKVDGRTTGL